METGLNKTDHIKTLAAELLDDIELNRLAPESLLLKATRLARFVDSPEIRQWLKYELQGYYYTTIGNKYMGLTGRWTEKEAKKGWWGPLAQIEVMIETNKLKMATLKIPNVSFSAANQNQYIPTNMLTAPVDKVINDGADIRLALNQLGGVRSRVLAILHNFVSSVYYQYEFSGLAESLFESFKRKVDYLLSTRCADVLERVPSVYNRLLEGDKEAISQALNSCRRIIDAFADSVYPPNDELFDIGGGQTLKVGTQNHQNRIQAYVYTHCTSKSRRQRLRQTLNNLYDRVSAGVHSDVSLHEARTLFLNTYLLLGEIIVIGNDESELESQAVEDK